MSVEDNPLDYLKELASHLLEIEETIMWLQEQHPEEEPESDQESDRIRELYYSYYNAKETLSEYLAII